MISEYLTIAVADLLVAGAFLLAAGVVVGMAAVIWLSERRHGQSEQRSDDVVLPR